MNFKEWFNKIVKDPNYLGKDLSKEAWDHQQKEIDRLKERIEDIIRYAELVGDRNRLQCAARGCGGCVICKDLKR